MSDPTSNIPSQESVECGPQDPEVWRKLQTLNFEYSCIDAQCKHPADEVRKATATTDSARGAFPLGGVPLSAAEAKHAPLIFHTMGAGRMTEDDEHKMIVKHAAMKVAQGDTPMFVIVFHELQVPGVSEQYWSSAPVPLQVSRIKEQRAVLNADLSGDISERRIPATGRAYVVEPAGTVVHSFDYDIPSVARSADNIKTRGIADFPGYADLPTSKWFQLNPSTDSHTIQVKMRKVEPCDVLQSISRGTYFVYTPIKMILRPPVSITPTPIAGPTPTSGNADIDLLNAL